MKGCTRRLAAAGLLVAVVAATLAAGGAGATEPQTLEDCYLRVAMQKQTADLAYLAREICDRVFARFPRAVTVLDPAGAECQEWWFDDRGRYESAERYCALEPTGGASWKLACQGKTGANKSWTFIALQERDGHYEPVGAVQGRPIGRLFTGLVPCVEARAAAGGS